MLTFRVPGERAPSGMTPVVAKRHNAYIQMSTGCLPVSARPKMALEAGEGQTEECRGCKAR